MPRDELHLYTPLRMPHHRRAKDDRHSYAAVSRFIDQAVLAVLKVVDEAAKRLPVTPGTQADVAVNAAVNMDALWD